MIKRTYNPSVRKRKKKLGFRVRMKNINNRKVTDLIKKKPEVKF